jgi:hypothetical protein
MAFNGGKDAETQTKKHDNKTEREKVGQKVV